MTNAKSGWDGSKLQDPSEDMRVNSFGILPSNKPSNNPSMPFGFSCTSPNPAVSQPRYEDRALFYLGKETLNDCFVESLRSDELRGDKLRVRNLFYGHVVSLGGQSLTGRLAAFLKNEEVD